MPVLTNLKESRHLNKIINEKTKKFKIKLDK